MYRVCRCAPSRRSVRASSFGRQDQDSGSSIGPGRVCKGGLRLCAFGIPGSGYRRPNSKKACGAKGKRNFS